MNHDTQEQLGTADLVAGADQQRRPPQTAPRPPEAAQRPVDTDPRQQPPHVQSGAGEQPPPRQDQEQLAALFPPAMASDLRSRWDQVQIGFVDDPRRAVQEADQLVAQVMKNLAASFAQQRERLEAGLNQGEQSNTENLRMALRSYRSFFQRLLSL